jgi:hypothetical protein
MVYRYSIIDDSGRMSIFIVPLCIAVIVVSFWQHNASLMMISCLLSDPVSANQRIQS